MAERLSEDYVRSELAKEGWVLIGDYKNATTKTRFYNPDIFNGLPCEGTIFQWLKGKRPKLANLVDPEIYIESVLNKEGWHLLSNYRGTGKHIYINNPDVFNGHKCRILFSVWMRGFRPCISSLVDPTSYIQEEFAKEGWELCSTYTGNKNQLLIRKPDFFSNSLVKFSWDAWNFGYRPAFQSLCDQKGYLEKSVNIYGWEFVKIDMNRNKPLLFLRHKDYFDNFLCKVFYCNWSKESKLDIRNIVDPTAYIKHLLNKRGFITENENWVYQGKEKRFSIIHVQSNEKHRINWSAICRNEFPYTARRRVYRLIHNFLANRRLGKKFCTNDIFPESYWVELSNKFPVIPEGMHVDHIVCSSFWGDSIEQLLLANDIRNLRLLTAKENLQRHNRLRASELDEYDIWDLFHQAENPKGYKLIEDRYDLAS